MRFDSCSWILGCARRALAVLAVLAVFSLANPSAFASITLYYSVSADSSTQTGNNGGGMSLSSGSNTIGNFTYTVTENATNHPAGSTLTTDTFSVNNTSATTDSITIAASGIGFTAGSNTNIMNVSYTITGNAAFSSSTDPASTNSWADQTGNAPFGTTTPVGALSGVVSTPGSPVGAYQFSGTGVAGAYSPIATFVRGTSPFSLSQSITVTLSAGDSASFVITTAASPSGVSVPEPSSMVIAGLGALGLIGYGLRRRKALGT